MERWIRQGLLVAMAVALSLSAGCTNWGDHTKWPEKHKFMGVEVSLKQTFRTGDYDVADAQKGQKLANHHTYYCYLKNNKEVLHGPATWWYEKGLRKAEATYIHGKLGDRRKWYYKGGLSRKVATNDDGEREEIFYRDGRLFGIQMFDRRSKKLTCIRNGEVVTLDEFMAQEAREIYGITRITP